MAFQTDGTKIQLAVGGSSWIHESPGTNPFEPAPYYQYSHFGLDHKTLVPVGNIERGYTSQYILDGVGDILLNLYFKIKVKTPDPFAWLAEHLFESVSIYCENDLIDHYSWQYQRLYYDMCLNQTKKSQWDKMTSAIGVAGDYLYLPLIFGFCNQFDQSLPTVGIMNRKIRVVVKWGRTNDFYKREFDSLFDTSDISLWGSIAFLGNEELNRVKYTNERILFDTVDQELFRLPKTVTETTQELHMYGIVKDLKWMITTPNVEIATSNNASAGWLEHPIKDVVSPAGNAAACTQPHQSSGVVRVTDMSKMRTKGFMLNGQMRLDKKPLFSTQTEKFFNLVQPYWYYKGCPSPGMYTYSWALQPHLSQPSGHINASLFEEKTLTMTLDNEPSSNLSMSWFTTNTTLMAKNSGNFTPLYRAKE